MDLFVRHFLHPRTGLGIDLEEIVAIVVAVAHAEIRVLTVDGLSESLRVAIHDLT